MPIYYFQSSVIFRIYNLQCAGNVSKKRNPPVTASELDILQNSQENIIAVVSF